MANALNQRWLWMGAMALAVVVAARPAGAEQVHRFALITANNAGGEGTRPLHFATADASRLHDILLRVGDVLPGDATLLLDATADDWRSALAALDRRMDAAVHAGEQPLLIVYYSGHAKEGDLRMGDTRLPIDELRQRVQSSAAAIRVGVVDACRSGVMNRTKGARKAPAFDVDTGVTRVARGMVLLTASAADEDAQESDELSASVFSHHLSSGLLGGADASGDKRVTLAEAYSYAYERTVADTIGTTAGAQHPTFSYDLAGNGDVVLTQLAHYREGLTFAADAPAGNYFVVDAKGVVAAELSKDAGVERRLSLPPGTYRIKRRLADRLRIGSLEIVRGQLTPFSESTLHDAPFTDDPVKGASAPRDSHWSVNVSGAYQSFFDGRLFPSSGLAGLGLSLPDYFRAGFVLGLDGAIGASRPQLTLGDAALPYQYGVLSFGASLTKEWTVGQWIPFAGARLAVITMHRRFDAAGLPEQSYFAMTPGLSGGVWRQLGTRWSIGARLRLHYLYYNVDHRESLGYLEGALLVSYDLGGP